MTRDSFDKLVACALLLLLGCDPEAGSTGPITGGNSGSEGSILPCEETETSLALDEPGPRLGFSAADVLALAARSVEVPMRWDVRDSGPTGKQGTDTLTLTLEPRGDEAVEVTCDDPDFPEEHRPEPSLRVPVTLVLRTDDGALDERLETTLVALEPNVAGIEIIEVPADQLAGTLGAEIAAFYRPPRNTVMVEITFTEAGSAGWIGGPFGLNASAPCAFTAYATWPADSECWPDIHAAPASDDVMQEHLDRINTRFDLTWDDDATTTVTLEVDLAEGPTCQHGEQVRHRVSIHAVSADGRVDLVLPGHLSGGPSSIDPWPEALSHIEPFDLQLTGGAALDAAQLAAALPSAVDADVSVAFTTLWVGSPGGIDDPVLAGGLHAQSLDRTGFDTPLPAIDVADAPGNAHCFSAPGARPPTLISGNLALR